MASARITVTVDALTLDIKTGSVPQDMSEWGDYFGSAVDKALLELNSGKDRQIEVLQAALAASESDLKAAKKPKPKPKRSPKPRQSNIEHGAG